jgi:hypothetical protein
MFNHFHSFFPKKIELKKKKTGTILDYEGAAKKK